MENVWDYPRPPALEPVGKSLRIVFGGVTIAQTTAGFRVLETSHPPVYYLPPDAFIAGVLEPASWSYPDPTPRFAAIRDHLAVYAGSMDACFVDDEAVVPQPGGFYGGWITADLIGPFKGVPGSLGW